MYNVLLLSSYELFWESEQMKEKIETIVKKYETDHIVKKYKDVDISLYLERKESPLQIVVVADANQYRTILYVGKVTFGTCACTGFYIYGRCKHIYAVAVKLQNSQIKKRTEANHSPRPHTQG